MSDDGNNHQLALATTLGSPGAGIIAGFIGEWCAAAFNRNPQATAAAGISWPLDGRLLGLTLALTITGLGWAIGGQHLLRRPHDFFELAFGLLQVIAGSVAIVLGLIEFWKLVQS